jgi:hypothetical protein
MAGNNPIKDNVLFLTNIACIVKLHACMIVSHLSGGNIFNSTCSGQPDKQSCMQKYTTRSSSIRFPSRIDLGDLKTEILTLS